MTMICYCCSSKQCMV